MNFTAGQGFRPADSRVALSIRALEYGAHLDPGADDLWLRLYRYNQEPLTAGLRAGWASHGGMAGHYEQIAAGKYEVRPRQGSLSDEPWMVFSGRQPPIGQRTEGPLYKLYISPPLALLTDVLAAIVPELTQNDCPPFKIGADISHAIRPEKIVVYPRSWSELEVLSQGLVSRLAGIEAVGVPFTANIVDNGLLSWAIDPRHEPARRHRSWRAWICFSVAKAFRELELDKASGDRVNLVLKHLRDELHVNTSNWSLLPAFRKKF